MIGRSSGPTRSMMASATAATSLTIGPIQGRDQFLPAGDVPLGHVVALLVVGLGFFRGGVRRLGLFRGLLRRGFLGAGPPPASAPRTFFLGLVLGRLGDLLLGGGFVR